MASARVAVWFQACCRGEGVWGGPYGTVSHETPIDYPLQLASEKAQHCTHEHKHPRVLGQAY